MSVGVETRSRLTGCAEFSSAEGIVEALVGVGGGCREAKGTGSPLVERREWRMKCRDQLGTLGVSD